MNSKLFIAILTVFFIIAIIVGVAFAEETEVALSISPEGESDAGESVFFEAKANGFENPEYQFGYRPVGGSWTLIDPGLVNTYTRSVPAGFSGGDFQVGVRVREAGGTWSAQQVAPHFINPVQPSVKLKVIPAGETALGDAVTLEASSEGVTNPEFRFGRKYEDGSWGTTAWREAPSRGYNPTKLGALEFGVQVREAGGSWLAVEIVAHEVVEEPLGRIFDEAGTYGPEDETDPETIIGDVIVKSDGVTLKNFIITGDLIIAEEVGDGEVSLNNLEVKGELIIRGGGADSIFVNGGEYSNIRIEEVDGVVRVIAVGVNGADGKPVDLFITEGAIGDDIFLEGNFKEVNIKAADSNINICAIVDVVNINADGVSVTLCAEADLDHMNINGENATVQGDGTVNTANVNANGARFQEGVIDPDDVTVGDGVEIDPVYFDPDPSWPGPRLFYLNMEANPVEGGTATDLAGRVFYAEGNLVEIKAEAKKGGPGWEFVNWTADAGSFEDADEKEITFTMPAKDVTVTANFKEVCFEPKILLENVDDDTVSDGDTFTINWKVENTGSVAGTQQVITRIYLETRPDRDVENSLLEEKDRLIQASDTKEWSSAIEVGIDPWELEEGKEYRFVFELETQCKKVVRSVFVEEAPNTTILCGVCSTFTVDPDLNRIRLDLRDRAGNPVGDLDLKDDWEVEFDGGSSTIKSVQYGVNASLI